MKYVANELAWRRNAGIIGKYAKGKPLVFFNHTFYTQN